MNHSHDPALEITLTVEATATTTCAVARCSVAMGTPSARSSRNHAERSGVGAKRDAGGDGRNPTMN